MLYVITLVITLTVALTAGEFFFLVPFCIGFIICSIVQMVCYHSHVDEIERLEEQKRNIDIYKKQADEVLAEIKIYMIDKFPDFEMKIFEKITSQTVDILAVKYPDLKTDEVFKKYVDSYVQFKGNIYNNKRRIEEYERKLRVRERTIKLTVLPILPKR